MRAPAILTIQVNSARIYETATCELQIEESGLGFQIVLCFPDTESKALFLEDAAAISENR